MHTYQRNMANNKHWIQAALWIVLFIFTLHLYLNNGSVIKIVSACVTSVPGKRLVNELLTDDSNIRETFNNLSQRKLKASDPEVIEMVQLLLYPPSDHVIKPAVPYSQLVSIFQTNQSRWVKDYFKEKKGGFFVECGALDGERSSNTIVLEQVYDWQGILIEADPNYFTQLLGKNRKSWSINACLSPSNTLEWLNLGEDAGGRGTMLLDGMEKDKLVHRGPHNPIVQSSFPVIKRIPCFPLESILLALNRATVDYFSLDVEGMEMLILENIPHDRIHIKTMSVEYDHVAKSDETMEEMKTKIERMGYSYVKKIDEVHPERAYWARDFIFVKS